MTQRSAPYYFICEPRRKSALQIALLVLVFAGISVGIFLGACMWAKAQTHGVVIVHDPVCEVCGQPLDGHHPTCEDER